MKKLSLFIIVLFLGTFATAQDLESEVGYLYTKAKYLLETNRSEEAIEVFTKVIKKDAHFKEAMALRAQAKYKMGDNKKARKDIIRFIEENGLTPGAVKTLSLINYKDKNYEAAANTLHTASLLFPNDVELKEKRAEVLYKLGQLSEACVAWHDAAKLGSTKAKRGIKKSCFGNGNSDGGVDPVQDYAEPKDDDFGNEGDDSYNGDDPISNEEQTDDTNTSSDDEYSDPEIDNDNSGADVEEEEEPVETYDITEIDLKEGKDKWLKLDEELSVNIVGGGLGDRSIVKMPNILLLTDEKGTIAIDLCVSKTGEVLAAKYNPEVSSMNHRNNMEYLLRKTKGLKFNEINATKCGRIIYNINMD